MKSPPMGFSHSDSSGVITEVGRNESSYSQFVSADYHDPERSHSSVFLR